MFKDSMASVHACAPFALQKIVVKSEKSLKGKTLAPVLSFSARMALLEKRLAQLEQDSLWWTEWKKDKQNEFDEHQRQWQIQSEHENVDGDLA